MKRLLLIPVALAITAGTASAADMLVKKAPPPPAVPVWSWTGFYLGGHIGGAWAKSEWFEDNSQTQAGGGPAGFQDASLNPSSFLGGGQVGFDYQIGWLVFGAQADADLADLNTTASGPLTCFPQAGGFQTCTVKVKSFGTVTERVGAAFDRALIYVLGGFAWEHQVLDNGCVGCVPAPVLFRSTNTRNGWTIGGGIEYAFLGNWSALVQYNYMSFGTRDLQFSTTLGDGLPPNTENVRDHMQVIKAGLNYRFNWGPSR